MAGSSTPSITYLALADEDFDDRYDNVDITVYGINEVVKDGGGRQTDSR